MLTIVFVEGHIRKHSVVHSNYLFYFEVLCSVVLVNVCIEVTILVTKVVNTFMMYEDFSAVELTTSGRSNPHAKSGVTIMGSAFKSCM